jgi:hypothetical protein
VEENFGAVKGLKRAVILEESSREGPAGPGNPDHAAKYRPPKLPLKRGLKQEFLV